MKLIEKVHKTIYENQLFDTSDKLLVACSGGIDSMTLVHILIKLKYNFGIAHIDHSTRNGTSMKDAMFVESFCKEKNIPFHIKTLPKRGSDNIQNENFQIYARNQRYIFFQELCNSQNYTKIILAHHADDSIETFLINLARGTGIKGLIGIPIKRNEIVRPLLELRKDEIIQFANFNHIGYRQDESNFENQYTRNYVRNKILPELRYWQEGVDLSILKTISHLTEANNYLQDSLLEWQLKLIKIHNDTTIIKLQLLANDKNAAFILFNVLSIFNFNKEQTLEILAAKESGKFWSTKSHTAYLERNQKLHIKDNVDNKRLKHFQFNKFIEGYGKFRIINISQDYTDHDYILIDKKLDSSKLEIRNWLDGDYMQTQVGKKKLKKIFQELKINNFDKKNLLLIAFKSEILWIVGKKKAFVKTPSEKAICLVNK